MSANGSASSVLDSFYNRHILRDLLAKIAPGAYLLAGIGATCCQTQQVIPNINEASLGTWLFFGLMAWLMGFGLQGVGELTGRLCKYLPIQYCTRGSEQSRVEAEAEFQTNLVKLDSNQKVSPDQKQRVERLIVIKEATANAFTAHLILISTLIGTKGKQLSLFWPLLAVLLVAMFGFWRFHLDNVRRQDEVIEKILNNETTTTISR